MNKFDLIKTLRGDGVGYNGSIADPDIVVKWLADNGLTLTDPKGKTIDVKAVLSQPDKAVQVDATPVTKSITIDAKNDADADGAARQTETKSAPLSPKNYRAIAQRKAYDRDAALGRTVYATSDQADIAASALRLAVTSHPGWTKDYALRSHDLEVMGKANQVVNTNLYGGALVVPEFSYELIRLKEEYGAMRAASGVVPMLRDTLSYPRLVDDISYYWMQEATAITGSNVTLNNVELTAKKLAALVPISNELMHDSNPKIADIVTESMARRFGYAEDDAAFNGDGTSTYGGITGIVYKLYNLSATKANIAGLVVGSGATWASLTLADHQTAQGRLPDYAAKQQNYWYCSRAYFFTVMDRLVRASGGVTTMEVRGEKQGPGIMNTGRQFLGDPVVFVQAMPQVSAGTQLNCLYGNIAMAGKFGEVTSGFQIDTSDQIKFYEDMFVIRAKERIDYVAHDVGNQSATAASRVPGPIVGVATS